MLDAAKVFERVSPPVVWVWATHFDFPRKILRVPRGYSEHQRRAHFDGCVAELLQTITAILPGSKWSCLLLRTVLRDASSEVMKVFISHDIDVFSGLKKRAVRNCGTCPEREGKWRRKVCRIRRGERKGS